MTPEVHALWRRGDVNGLHDGFAINGLSVYQLQDRQTPTHNMVTVKSASASGKYPELLLTCGEVLLR